MKLSALFAENSAYQEALQLSPVEPIINAAIVDIELSGTISSEAIKDELCFPIWCSQFCEALVGDGCSAWLSRWIPWSRMNKCPKVRLWQCDTCDQHHQGWCKAVPGKAYVNIDVMGFCPIRSPEPVVPLEEPWDYDAFARSQGCFGCNFFRSGYGDIECRYDDQVRTEANQKPCLLNSGRRGA